jgi:hypothetical protein
VLFACDVFGNAGGDYTDCIVGWNGRLDNFRADPLFWDRNNRDFRTHYGYYHVTATYFSGNEGEASTQAISSVQETGAAPTAFYLGAAIPTPSTAVTKISYGIPIGAQRSRVALRVYDPAGRLVSTLVDADHGPGTYRATWMGADDRGQPAANGVYFCRIEWNGRSETRRMVLLK